MVDRTLTIQTDDGKEIICDILFTYFSEEFNKSYVVFSPRGLDEVSAAIYVEHGDGSGELTKIESEEEWDMLEDLLDDYYNNNGAQGGCAGCAGSCSSDCGGCGGDGCDGCNS